MANQRTGALQKIGILQQPKDTNHWTAPNDATAVFKTCNYNANTSQMNPNVTSNLHDWTAASGIYPEYDRLYTDSVTGLHRLPFSGTVTKALLPQHLVAAFQRVDEYGTTPFPKGFKPVATDLDFAGNDGYLFTVAEGNIAGDGKLLKNALLESFKLTADNTQTGNGCLLKMDGTWVGNEIEDNQTFSGTWVAQPKTGFYNTTDQTFAVNLTVGGTSLGALRWFTFEMNVNNTIDYTPTSGGKAANYSISQEVTYNILLPYHSTTMRLFADYRAGSKIALTAGIGDGSEDGDLSFVTANAKLTAPPVESRGKYVGIRLQFTEYKGSSDWASAYTSGIVLMSDAVDAGF